MGQTTFCSGRGIVHPGSGGTDIGMADICYVDTPNGPVAIPFINIGKSIDLNSGPITIKTDGCTPVVKTYFYDRSTGHELATLKSLISKAYMGPCIFEVFDFIITFEGQNVCRVGDILGQNITNDIKNIKRIRARIACLTPIEGVSSGVIDVVIDDGQEQLPLSVPFPTPPNLLSFDIGEGILNPNSPPPANDEKTKVSDPIDVATGNVLTEAVDLIFSLPFRYSLERTWSSTLRAGIGCFGRGWTSVLDCRVFVKKDQITFVDEEGRTLEFDELVKGQWNETGGTSITLLVDDETVTVKRDDGTLLIFSNEEQGNYWKLVAIADQFENGILFNYEDGILRSIRDSGNLLYNVEWSEQGYITEIWGHKPSLRRRVRYRQYRYDKAGNLTSVTDESGYKHRYAYDDKNRLIRNTNVKGYSFHFEYDDEDRCIESWGEDGGRKEYIRKFNYDTDKKLTTVTNSFGAEKKYYWNKNKLVVEEVDALGGSKLTFHNENNKVVGTVDQNGDTEQFLYNDNGSIEEKVDKAGNRWSVQYDDNLAYGIDPLGNAVAQLFDFNKHPLFIFDKAGNIRRQQNGIRYRNPFHPVDFSQCEVNEAGNVTSITDRLGNEITFKYSNRGELLKIIDGNDRITSFDYDENANCTSVTKPDGSKRQFTYNGLRQLLNYRNEEEHTVAFDYNEEGKLAAITNENGEKHVFLYDAVDRLVKDVGFDEQEIKYQYDNAGNITKVVTGESMREISHSRTGQITAITATTKNGASSTNYYDYDKAGRLIRAENEHSKVLLEYDALGRIVKEQQNDFVVEKSYDSSGNLLSIRNNIKQDIAFGYSEEDLLESITLPDKTVISVSSSEEGLIERETIGEAVTVSRSFDEEGRITSLEYHKNSSNGSAHYYEYDEVSRIIREKDAGGAGKAYTYDKKSQVTEVTAFDTKGNELPGEKETFTYDEAGNCVANGSLEKRMYSAGNRLMSSGKTVYTFDEMGQVTSRKNEGKTLRYTFNGFGQLERCQLPDGSSVTYRYDALGRRIAKEKSSDGTTVTFFYNEFQLHAEVGATEKVYFYYPESHVPLALVDSRLLYFYRTSHTGTPEALTTREGRKVWACTYTAFGNRKVSEKTIIENNLAFPGQYVDEETGLHYNMYRYYCPETSRYISKDPVSYLTGQFNLYCYCGNDPVNKIDFMGLEQNSIAPPMQTTPPPQINPSDVISGATNAKVANDGYTFGDLLIGGFNWLDEVSTATMALNIPDEAIWQCFGYYGLSLEHVLGGAGRLIAKIGRKTSPFIDDFAKWSGSKFKTMWGKFGFKGSFWSGTKEFIGKGWKRFFGKNFDTVADVVNTGSEAILKNGYYEVNGFKYTKYYFEKLWNTGRYGSSLVAKEILKVAGGKEIPHPFKAGFYKYTALGWELVYNPVTKEIWHIQPIR